MHAFDCLYQVLEWQICSEPKRDSHRFMDAIEVAIEEVRLELVIKVQILLFGIEHQQRAIDVVLVCK